MGERLAGRVAVITGSTSGIGAGIARAMAREGARVVVSGRRRTEGEAVAASIRDAGGEAVFHAADLSNVRECAPLVERARTEYGGLDILVNNAGIFPVMTFEETTPELWDSLFAVNARAAFFCAQAATPMLRQRGGGSIINIGSTHPFGVGTGQFAYGISKGALHTMTRKLAMLLAPDRIRVNWITVGWVLTEQERALRNVPEDDTEWIEKNRKRMPMQEFTTVEDVSEACVYLASDAGRNVTGTDMAVCSGISVRL